MAIPVLPALYKLISTVVTKIPVIFGTFLGRFAIGMAVGLAAYNAINPLLDRVFNLLSTELNLLSSSLLALASIWKIDVILSILFSYMTVLASFYLFSKVTSFSSN